MEGYKYAVMKLNKDLCYDDPVTGKEITVPINGCSGYIPVFDTVEEAQDHSRDGKYSIIAIQPEKS